MLIHCIKRRFTIIPECLKKAIMTFITFLKLNQLPSVFNIYCHISIESFGWFCHVILYTITTPNHLTKGYHWDILVYILFMKIIR